MNCLNPGKIAYKSAALAGKTVKKLRARGRRGLDIYWCPGCKAYHIGRERFYQAPSKLFLLKKRQAIDKGGLDEIY